MRATGKSMHVLGYYTSESIAFFFCFGVIFTSLTKDEDATFFFLFPQSVTNMLRAAL